MWNIDEEIGKVQVLLELLSKTYLAKEDLTLLFKDRNTIYPILKDLCDESHIKEHEIAFLYHGHKKRITYYSLTEAGFRFLQNVQFRNDNYNWIKYADTLPEKISLTGNNPLSERYLNMTGTMLFLEDIIKRSECMYPLGIEQNSVSEFVESYSPYKAVIIPDESRPLNFYDGNTVKQVAKEYSAQNLELNNGRYIGLISSEIKSCLVYHTEYKGVLWSRWYAESDKKALRYFTKASGIRQPKIGEEKAILIVRNEKDLAYAHWDREKVRRQSEKLGDGFKELAVFPQTQEGKAGLLQFMRNDREELVNEAMAKALYELDDDGDNVYSINSSYPNPKLFPILRTEDKALIHIGCVMDIISIRQIERVLANQIENVSLGYPSGNKIVVMCYKWQVPYYKTLLPMVEILEI